jgi:hypothetical protein
VVTKYKDTTMVLDLVKIIGLGNRVVAVNVNGQSHVDFLYNSFDNVRAEN